MRTVAFLLLLLSAPVLAQNAEKRVIVTITAAELKGGVVSEIAWDHGTVVLQGVFVKPDGTLAAQYFVTPADTVALEQRTEHTPESARYWESKARTLSPTGIGRIATSTDAKLPMYGIAGQAQRMSDAVDMGGTQKFHVVRLNKLILYERTSDAVPYDGEVWSWSPAELNRIAYINKDGDLWVARADGSNPQRLLKGNFTLPAWSDDGRLIAVAEQKNGGRKWEISIVHVPPQHRQ
ncbi:MAG: hypothetical protein H0U19_07630 [Acidobacteria bacterium]|nr:hypothetical protein [Acidobacteriota bacterium]